MALKNAEKKSERTYHYSTNQTRKGHPMGLSLSRKRNQSITIGDDIKVTIQKIDGNKVSVKIEAPADRRILRAELKPEDGCSAGRTPHLSGGEK